jgi:hypothetical protein
MAGEVSDAAGVDAVRAVLARLFDHFVIHLGRPNGPCELELIGDGLWIEPVVREEAIEGYADDDKLRPILRREPLAQSSSRGKDSISSMR